MRIGWSCTLALLIGVAPWSARAAGVFHYDWLTPTNLPPPTRLIQSALAAMPKTVKEQQNWVERMRRAAWMPNLELRYSIGDAVVRDYQVVQRSEVARGREHTDEISRESSSGSGRRTGSGSETQRDGLGVLVGQNESSSSEVTRDRSSTTGRRTSDSRSSSLTYSGPDSYATGERMRWVDEYGIAFTWDLSRLLFREEEMSIAGIEMDKESFRQNVRAQVIQAYYDLMETLLLLDSQTYRSSVPTQVKRERMAYLLDSLTDGALSAAAGRTAP